jgi:pimeloyl-ACP methyl ester carboxylesterase
MFGFITGLLGLRWTQQPPQARPLPPHIERTFVPTPLGDLELLICRSDKAKSIKRQAPPVFFAHGGVGSAGVWLEWMNWLHDSGYPGTLYAYSLRGHGGSYSLPYYSMVYKTSLDACADDLVACYERAREDAGEDLVIVGHSSGGGLVQYALSKGLVKAKALCLVGAVPHTGSYDLYWNWLKHDPWFPLRSMFHLQHPNSPLSTVELVRTAFFGHKYPVSHVPDFMRYMAPYESMGWPFGMFGDFSAWRSGTPRWLDPVDILRNVSRTSDTSAGDAICVMAGSEDMMMGDLAVCRRQAVEFRIALNQMYGSADSKQEPAPQDGIEGVERWRQRGVRLVSVRDAGHHVQNDVQCEQAAMALNDFLLQV